MRWRSIPIVCVLLAAAAPAEAQQLQPGTRVDDDAPPSELEGLQYAVAGIVFVVATAAGGLVGTFVKSPRWVRVVPAGVGVSIGF
jgi:hypothetical protein